MPPALLKIVAVFLLFVQGAIALAPGQVLCIPLRDCGHHEPDAAPACQHSHCTSNPAPARGHDDADPSPLSALAVPVDDCGCHIHVAVPNDEQLPSKSRALDLDLKTVVLPLVVALVQTWDAGALRVAVTRPHPPDFSASDQVRALKVTRLLI